MGNQQEILLAYRVQHRQAPLTWLQMPHHCQTASASLTQAPFPLWIEFALLSVATAWEQKAEKLRGPGEGSFAFGPYLMTGLLPTC